MVKYCDLAPINVVRKSGKVHEFPFLQRLEEMKYFLRSDEGELISLQGADLILVSYCILKSNAKWDIVINVLT